MLKHSPSTIFLIPGLFLLLVIGVGNLLVGYSNVRKYQSYVYFEWFIGMVQLFWIMLHCIMLHGIVVLHGLFFLFGIVQILGSIWLIKKDNVPFPFSANQN